MRKYLWPMLLCLLLTFSCTGKKADTEMEMDVPADSVADSSLVAVEDTLERLITETPMPRAADAYFDDFVFNFTANKRLQFERIVFPLRVTEADGKMKMTEKSQWKMEHLFMRQGYYTLLFDDDAQMSHMKDTAVNEAVVEKIMLRKNQVKNYFFHRVRGAWMMYEVRTVPMEENVNASFLSFYKRFTTDSVFQVQSINETVQFVGPDPDDDFNMMEGVITPDTWEAFAPQLPEKVLYNIVYGKHEAEGNKKIFLMRGVANGLEVELRFKKVGGKWLLMKMTT
jgi:hypothetical protein